MAPVFKSVFPLILASGSPRRRDFLRQLGLEFRVASSDIPEELQEGEGAADFVRRLALAKAALVARANPGAAVVGADTVVVREGDILGKPADVAEAIAMVKSLAGGWHEVWTGFALLGPAPGQQTVRAVRTRVCFADLGPEVCRAYGESGDGLDKAGGYGIQSAGAFLVAEIKGSYSNVIGLPLSEL
ncbi:MAG: Maf family protein, partial [Thermodesulfobacteriota bacterium]